jgi:hypothetical protein
MLEILAPHIAGLLLAALEATEKYHSRLARRMMPAIVKDK